MSWDEQTSHPSRRQRIGTQLHKARLALRIAGAVFTSDIRRNRVAWISVDSDGTVHVADGQESGAPSGGTVSIHLHGDGVAKSMESIKDSTNTVIKLVGSAESIR